MALTAVHSKGSGSVVVISLFIVAPIYCLVLCLVLVLLYSTNFFTIILLRRRELVALFK